MQRTVTPNVDAMSSIFGECVNLSVLPRTLQPWVAVSLGELLHRSETAGNHWIIIAKKLWQFTVNKIKRSRGEF